MLLNSVSCECNLIFVTFTRTKLTVRPFHQNYNVVIRLRNNELFLTERIRNMKKKKKKRNIR